MTKSSIDTNVSSRLKDELKKAHTRAVFLCENIPPEWISDSPKEIVFEKTRQSNYRQYLGGEASILLIDVRHHFNANAIAALIGTLSAGGLAYLLLPPRTAWSPFMTRLAALGNTQVTLLSNTQTRAQWQQQYQAKCLEMIDAIKALSSIQPTLEYPSSEQSNWLNQVKKKTPQLLIADRGRGKSTALGLALNRCPERKVIVTAPQPSAITSLQRACTNRVTFVAWQTLYERRKPAADDEWLIIDEAAALPKSVLISLLSNYRVWMLATTLDGYEGCGRSIGKQLTDLINNAGGSVSRFMQPVRWRNDDLVEDWLNQSFMLKLDLNNDITSSAPLTYQFAHAQELLEQQCQAIMNLMLEAHYQTQPSDLKRLFDDPKQWLLLAWQGDILIGAVWLIQEGQLDTELALEILQGQRRPPGNLLPQALGRYFQNKDLFQKKWWRIARITVHKNHQRQGIGGQLLQSVRKYARRHHVDLIGTAFGQRQDLLSFWQKSHYKPVYFGRKLNKSSGENTVYCIDNQSPEGAISKAQLEFAQQLQEWLYRGQLSDLSEECRHTIVEPQTEAFAKGYLAFPEAHFALLQSYRNRLSENIDAPLSTADLARQNGYASQADFVQALRRKIR